MSRDLMGPMVRSEEDVEAVFMKKFTEKRKILEEAQAMYNALCANVEKANIELSGIKMELFKTESALQKIEIRIKVYEKREMELRDEAERARTSIEEAEIEQKKAHAARDGHNKGFIKRIMEMAEDHCRFKSSCDRKKVSDTFQDLTEADTQLDIEIKEVMADMGIKDGQNRVSLVSPDSEDECTLQNLRDLQNQLKYDLQCSELSNANIQAQTDQLRVLKNSLQKEIEALREIMEK